MFLVLDHENGTMTSQINSLNSHQGGIDTVNTVDTGGDALYSVHEEQGFNSAKTTPDQDLRVLAAIRDVSVRNRVSAIVAVGIDSPANATAILEAASARYYTLDPQ